MSASSSALRRSALIALAAASLTLTACAPPVGPDGSPSPSASTSTPSDSESAPPDEHREDPGQPTAPPTSTTRPDAGEDVGLACDDVITLQQMYDFNPNVSALGQYTPEAGSLGDTVVSYNGLTCRWSNNTSGRTIDVAIAKLDPETLADLSADASKSAEPVSVYGDEGYFGQSSGVGTAQIFTGSYWVVLSSKDFTTARGAEQLAGYVVGNLP